MGVLSLSKNLAASALAAFCLLPAGSAQGQSRGDYNGFTWSSDGTIVQITGYDGSGVVANLPGSIPVAGVSLPVTSVGFQAFMGSGLAGVTIPASITSLGVKAFANCPSLTNVCFEGDAPTPGPFLFLNDTNLSVILYVNGTAGWGSTFSDSDIPTAVCVRCTPIGSLKVTLSPATAITAGAKWELDGEAVYYKSGVTLTNLPVGSHAISFKPVAGWITPSNQDVEIAADTVAKRTGVYTVADVIKPVLTISLSHPGAVTQRLHGDRHREGQAAVAGVNWQLNGGGWNPAGTGNAWKNWSATNLSLFPGTNVFSAYAVDTSTNYSRTNTVKFEYVVKEPMTVQIVGRGAPAPNYNGKLLAVNTSYKMTAVPAPGFAFGYWSGGVAMSTNRALTFTMSTNLTIIANFKDVARPVNVIVFPTANRRWTNAVVTVTGKAHDNVAVSDVWFQINTNDWAEAETTNQFGNWSATNLTVISGTNLVQAFAVDAAGNVSLTNRVKFRGVPP